MFALFEYIQAELVQQGLHVFCSGSGCLGVAMVALLVNDNFFFLTMLL